MSNKNKYDFSSIFDKVKNRPIHARLTKEIINATVDEDLTQTIIDNIQINNKRKADGEIYAGLTRGQRIIYSTYLLETHVFNSGLAGFYLSTNCELNQFIEQDMIALNAAPLADMVRKANELIALPDTADLTALDKEFDLIIEMDRLDLKRITYIRENSAEFID